MAIRNALANDDTDYQKILKMMSRKMKTQAMHSKINTITNGELVGLDYIEIPKGELFVSRISGELFRYNQGVLKSYPPKKDKPEEYRKYHVLKVIPDDAMQAEVEMLKDE